MLGWIAVAVIVWLAMVAAALVLLTAAKRAEAAAQADRPPVGPGWQASTRTRRRSPSHRGATAGLDRLACNVRRELMVDQVMVVARDERAPQGAVVVAAAGLPAGLVHVAPGPRDSVAVAVALTGHAVIAPDHGPLAGRRAEASGDAAAVPLTDPLGAVAIARLGGAARLTSNDLERLRTLVRHYELAGRDTSLSGDPETPSTGPGQRFVRPDGPAGTPDTEAAKRRPRGPSSWSSGR